MKRIIPTLALAAATLALTPASSAITLDDVVAEQTYADCLALHERVFGTGSADLSALVCGWPEKSSPHLSQEVRERKAVERKACRADVTKCAAYVADVEVGE